MRRGGNTSVFPPRPRSINETESDQMESDISQGEKQKVQVLLITCLSLSWLFMSGVLRAVGLVGGDLEKLLQFKNWSTMWPDS